MRIINKTEYMEFRDSYAKAIEQKTEALARIQRERRDGRTEIVPDERTAPFVRDIFKWKREGLSIMAILEKLEAAGAPIPETLQRVDGNLDGVNTVCWSRSTLFQILKNPAYTGDFAVGRSRKAIYAGIKELQIHDKGKWYITPDAHEGL